jgi:hypothetical protein
MPAVVEEMMLGEPYAVKTERIRSLGFFEHLLVEARHTRMEFRKERGQMKQ